MRRFFLDHTPALHEVFTLPPDESKHIGKVLRMQVGESLELVNGKGLVFTAKITDNHFKHCKVEITEKKQFPKDDFHIHIAIAPTKNVDRLSHFIEKSTELGIHEVSLIICENSERKVINTEKLEKVIIGAMKQSKRLYKPILHSPISFDEFIEKHPIGLIAHCYEPEKDSIHKVLTPQNCPILIGPEGDFSQEEVTKATSCNYKSISLGKTRLRTETAALYACAIAKMKFE